MKMAADESEDTFSGMTVSLDVRASRETGEAVVTTSREQCTAPAYEVGLSLYKLFATTEKKPRSQETTMGRIIVVTGKLVWSKSPAKAHQKNIYGRLFYQSSPVFNCLYNFTGAAASLWIP